MSNLTTNYRKPQLKAIVVPGYFAIQYIERVQDEWQLRNHGEIERAVVEFNEKGVTDGSNNQRG